MELSVSDIYRELSIQKVLFLVIFLKFTTIKNCSRVFVLPSSNSATIIVVKSKKA